MYAALHAMSQYAATKCTWRRESRACRAPYHPHDWQLRANVDGVSLGNKCAVVDAVVTGSGGWSVEWKGVGGGPESVPGVSNAPLGLYCHVLMSCRQGVG